MTSEINPAVEATERQIVYREVQHFRQWWLWVLVLGLAGLAWWAFLQQILIGKSFGENAAPDWAVILLWIVIGLALPLLFHTLKLVIEVTPEQVRVRFRPLVTRVIPLSEIKAVEARRYNAVLEYGGWGVKGWSRGKTAYNVSGDRGVDLHLRDGRSVLLGSQRAEELAVAIEAQRKERHSAAQV